MNGCYLHMPCFFFCAFVFAFGEYKMYIKWHCDVISECAPTWQISKTSKWSQTRRLVLQLLSVLVTRKLISSHTS